MMSNLYMQSQLAVDRQAQLIAQAAARHTAEAARPQGAELLPDSALPAQAAPRNPLGAGGRPESLRVRAVDLQG